MKIKAVKQRKKEIIEDLKQRRGGFRVSYDLVENHYELYLRLMKNIVPVLIVPANENSFYVEGCSVKFELTSEKEETPIYHWVYDPANKKFVFNRVQL